MFARLLAVASVVSAGAVLLGACASTAHAPACATGAVSRLYLGLETPAGEVTDTQWQTFVTNRVTPRFPEGFTVIDGHGQWRDGNGQVVRESTRILEFVHDGTPEPGARVQSVASDYKRTFSQHSVLVTQAPSSYCF